MRIDFTKMHGLGNDFIVLNLPSEASLPGPEAWRALSDRHGGIGFDQALVLLPPRRADTDVFYRVFNADGGEVEQCGNGGRCCTGAAAATATRSSWTALAVCCMHACWATAG